MAKYLYLKVPWALAPKQLTSIRWTKISDLGSLLFNNALQQRNSDCMPCGDYKKYIDFMELIVSRSSLGQHTACIIQDIRQLQILHSIFMRVKWWEMKF